MARKRKEDHVKKERTARGIIFMKRAIRDQKRDKKKRLSGSKRKFWGPGLTRYRDFFWFRNQDIAGKNILDVGSAQGKFQTEAKRVGATVIGVDPSYANKKSRKQLKKTHRKSAGLVQSLPFRSHSFDIAFARRVIPDKVVQIDRYMGVRELLRVIKPGGWVGIGPYLDDPSKSPVTTRAIFNLKLFLDNGGYKYESETMDVPVPRRRGEVQIHTYFKIYNTGNLQKLEEELKKM